MKKIDLTVYLMGWMIYVLFSFSMYPALKVTVFLFSLPLTMMGGWFFRYKGALLTILLLIPYHYIMLRYHTGLPGVLRDAFNPFGLGTQLVFSLGTAQFRITQLNYQQLNSTLEFAVLARTRDLTNLTDHLIEAKEMMFALTDEGLLKDPINKLSSMVSTSALLVRQLEETKHPGAESAITINKLIHLCSHQLNSIGKKTNETPSQLSSSANPIENLVDEFSRLAGKKTTIRISGNWNRMNTDTLQRLHPFIHEALANALRHANPKQIIIGIQTKPSSFIISVENDGTPMPDKIKEGMGLPLMRYYARQAGGLFLINDEAGENTRVECAIPR